MTTTISSTPEQLASSTGQSRGILAFLAKYVVLEVVIGLVLVLGAVGWSLWPSDGKGLTGGTPIEHVVQSRTFNVLLKEKGELQAVRSTDIKCEVEGRATIISLIDEGAAVNKGDLLVELASDEIENRIQQEELKEANAITAFESAKTELDIQRDKNASDVRKAQLKIELSKLELEKYEKGDWSQKLKDAEIAIEEAQINLDRRAEDYKAAKELLSRNFITRTEYEEDEFKYQKAQWELDKALRGKEVLEQYTHVAELRQKQSDVEEAIKEAERAKKNAEAEETKKAREMSGKEKELKLVQTQLEKLRSQMAKCRITAPSPGFVVYFSGGGRRFWSNDDQIKEGASVHERQILMQLPDTSEMTVVVRIHEAKTNRLQLGQRATVTVEGVQDMQFEGKVTKIAVLADTQNRWLNPDLKEYETEITLEPTDIKLKPGATAHVEIMVEKVADTVAVPVQAIYTKMGSRYVFRKSGSDVEAVPVVLGSVSDEWAAISSGIKPGDNVLLANLDNHKHLISGESKEGPGTPSGMKRGKAQRMRGKDASSTPRGQRRKAQSGP